MKKSLYLWALIAVVLIALTGCENKKLPVPKEIEIPASSKEVFSAGISFDSGITEINTGTDPGDGTWDDSGEVPGEESGEESEEEEVPQVKDVQFTAPSPWTAAVTETKALDWLTVEPMSGAAGEVKMTVTAQGNTTYQERRAAVTIKAGGSEATFEVVQAPKPIPVSSVTLDKSEITLAEGETLTLTATVKPDDAADKTVTWATSNKGVATVDASGKVTALRAGKATIRAKSGKKSAYCKLSVTASATGISMNRTTLELTEGETETLTVRLEPANTTDPVTWSSSDPSVATVDAGGKITAVKAGSAAITAQAGDMSATCTVTVKAKVIPVSSVSLNKPSLELTEGDSETLTATVAPDNASDKTVSWSSSDATIASVDANGRVTAVKAGSATITAQAGDLSATCTVTVKAKIIPVTSVSLNKPSLELTEGDTETLTATIAPDNATDKTVSWSSSDATTASVDATGKVTAVKAGTATITAKAGDKSATCTVTVEALGPKAVDLGLSVKWADCNLGAANPEDAGDYYAWGYAQPDDKELYGWTNYTLCNGTSDSMKKYCNDADFGSVDNILVLEPADDAAFVKLGGTWRMPTFAELLELMDENKCDWSKEILNGVKGYRVTSKMPGHTGESIFLPTQTYSADLETDWELEPGYELGLYWSSSIGDGNDDYYSPTPNLAYSLVFDYDTTPPTFDILNRFCRLSIRPVCK